MKRWQCVVCGWVYDEAEGAPEEGIPWYRLGGCRGRFYLS